MLAVAAEVIWSVHKVYPKKYAPSSIEAKELSYRGNYLESRQRYLAKYDDAGVEQYEKWMRQMTKEDHLACLEDINQGFQFIEGMKVLDTGAGTGVLCTTLAMVPGLRLTALEPCPAMLSVFGAKPELSEIETVKGFCDHPSDRETI